MFALQKKKILHRNERIEHYFMIFNFLKARTVLLDHCLDDKYHHKVKCGFDIFATSLLTPDDFKRKPD